MSLASSIIRSVLCISPARLRRQPLVISLLLGKCSLAYWTQIVNKDLHAAYAQIKDILKQDLAIVKARKESSGSMVLPAVAIAAAAIAAFYFMRS